jgi:hypothetical protein
MILTNKCKEAFDKWYNIYIKQDLNKVISSTDVNYFNLLTDAMKFGVYQDFFDGEGLRIYIDEGDMLNYRWRSYEYDGDERGSINFFDTRHEARTEAIKQANQIYNDRV